ncbi:SIS domain-containing protein [Caproiciproducens galactitolivorans]|uniref:SIS domain-containing protein n=1 Tax=Caproiciproducens galactitolivorans TaxID=642589 RepID=A0ABT4BR62_9FIRM|nr:SIS domain-containing protein [Caproiciproducens galactitolivorans]MCY1713367.1 SIS domain-containing protein [Caproiciproducens galactitolivorans]
MYLTEQEIMATKDALDKTYAQVLRQEEEIRTFFRENTERKFILMGCGSSYMLSKSNERMFITRPNTSAAALAGGDYLVNPDTYLHTIENSIVLVLSRSGMTTEIVRAVEYMKKTANVKVVSITMKENSALEGLSDLTVVLPWAYDNSVCQTRSVTNLYAASLLINAICYGDGELKAAVKTVIDQNRDHMEKYRSELETIGKKDFTDVVVLADGVLCGIAEEGALAFTEISLISGKYFPMLDYRHGPKVLNNARTLTIFAVQPNESTYQRDMIDDVKKHNGTVVTFGSEPTNVYGSDLHISVSGINRFEAYGIPFIYTMQMIALTKALATGINPDAPTGLNAYITLK